jgi:molecular chaperone GrpE (heat shock protein)/DNA-binding Xre family transcriptional regulator
MEAAGISSQRSLAHTAEVSVWQVRQLAAGKVEMMRVDVLRRLSQALNVSLVDLIDHCSEAASTGSAPAETGGDRPRSTHPGVEIAALQQEYQRLQAQLTQQQQQTQHAVQRASLDVLEPLLVQLPTAIHAAQQRDDIPATRLIPLLRPIEQLLNHWGIEAIAPVGTILPFDPHLHQPMGGNPQPGDPVRVRYVGYCQGETLLYRAKVSPAKPES